jgi:hypothetical protein
MGFDISHITAPGTGTTTSEGGRRRQSTPPSDSQHTHYTSKSCLDRNIFTRVGRSTLVSYRTDSSLALGLHLTGQDFDVAKLTLCC